MDILLMILKLELTPFFQGTKPSTILTQVATYVAQSARLCYETRHPTRKAPHSEKDIINL